ncbi:hypothetical protein DFS34DRAFT_185282 [Phlyctochytrium arcticum]|nr:hypothetical protein DFS34DRAFT_185282 [Phlyctochytrium arcticum]
MAESQDSGAGMLANAHDQQQQQQQQQQKVKVTTSPAACSDNASDALAAAHQQQQQQHPIQHLPTPQTPQLNPDIDDLPAKISSSPKLPDAHQMAEEFHNNPRADAMSIISSASGSGCSTCSGRPHSHKRSRSSSMSSSSTVSETGSASDSDVSSDEAISEMTPGALSKDHGKGKGKLRAKSPAEDRRGRPRPLDLKTAVSASSSGLGNGSLATPVGSPAVQAEGTSEGAKKGLAQNLRTTQTVLKEHGLVNDSGDAFPISVLNLQKYITMQAERMRRGEIQFSSLNWYLHSMRKLHADNSWEWNTVRQDPTVVEAWNAAKALSTEAANVRARQRAAKEVLTKEQQTEKEKRHRRSADGTPVKVKSKYNKTTHPANGAGHPSYQTQDQPSHPQHPHHSQHNHYHNHYPTHLAGTSSRHVEDDAAQAAASLASLANNTRVDAPITAPASRATSVDYYPGHYLQNIPQPSSSIQTSEGGPAIDFSGIMPAMMVVKNHTEDARFRAPQDSKLLPSPDLSARSSPTTGTLLRADRGRSGSPYALSGVRRGDMESRKLTVSYSSEPNRPSTPFDGDTAKPSGPPYRTGVQMTDCELDEIMMDARREIDWYRRARLDQTSVETAPIQAATAEGKHASHTNPLHSSTLYQQGYALVPGATPPPAPRSTARSVTPSNSVSSLPVAHSADSHASPAYLPPSTHSLASSSSASPATPGTAAGQQRLTPGRKPRGRKSTSMISASPRTPKTPGSKRMGRPPGSKNKKKLFMEAVAAAQRANSQYLAPQPTGVATIAPFPPASHPYPVLTPAQQQQQQQQQHMAATASMLTSSYKPILPMPTPVVDRRRSSVADLSHMLTSQNAPSGPSSIHLTGQKAQSIGHQSTPELDHQDEEAYDSGLDAKGEDDEDMDQT